MLAKLPGMDDVDALRPQFADACRKVYDEWIQDDDGIDEELGTGGICHLIADAVVGVVDEHLGGRVRVSTRSLYTEVHVDVLLATAAGVVRIDVPWNLYERGGGYHWRKIPDVVFTGDSVTLEVVDPEPSSFWTYVEDGPEEDDELLAAARAVRGETEVLKLWHASDEEISEFRPFTHFGTREAAIARASTLRGDFHLHEVEVETSLCVDIGDAMGNRHDLRGMLESLETGLELDFREVDAMTMLSGDAFLRAFSGKLLSMGIDCLKYVNAVEDEGSVSYSAIDPSRITVMSVTRKRNPYMPVAGDAALRTFR